MKFFNVFISYIKCVCDVFRERRIGKVGDGAAWGGAEVDLVETQGELCYCGVSSVADIFNNGCYCAEDGGEVDSRASSDTLEFFFGEVGGSVDFHLGWGVCGNCASFDGISSILFERVVLGCNTCVGVSRSYSTASFGGEGCLEHCFDSKYFNCIRNPTGQGVFTHSLQSISSDNFNLQVSQCSCTSISSLGTHNLSGRWGRSGHSAHFYLSCNALHSLLFYKGATPQLVCGKELRFIQHVTEGTSERDYSIWQAYLFWAQWTWSRRINAIRCTQSKSYLYTNYRKNSTLVIRNSNLIQIPASALPAIPFPTHSSHSTHLDKLIITLPITVNLYREPNQLPSNSPSLNLSISRR